MRDLVNKFSALADPTRLEMLALLLRQTELCVCDFVGVLGISQSKASRHLRYLWNAKLVVDRRDGLWVYYRVPPDLTVEGKAIVSCLRRVFGEADLADLERRLERWLKQKAKGAADCRSDQTKQARAGAHAEL
jgi:ArsR family transcriptional regulator